MRKTRSTSFGPHTGAAWRSALYRIIFEADTPAGKWFDIILIIVIGMSVLVVMLDSVHALRQEYLLPLRTAEWGFTLLFTVEYVFRLLSVDRPWRYACSFFGIVDLIAVVPTYFAVFLPASTYLVVVRTLRILRVFRILKLGAYLGEADALMRSLKASRRKIEVFLFVVVNLVIIFGALMYLIEGEEHGFTSIPRSIYWAIVTLTTVGYGDITPATGLGQTLSAVIMICGYGIIAVPTGIVSAEMVWALGRRGSGLRCTSCGDRFHHEHAVYCKSCGRKLDEAEA